MRRLLLLGGLLLGVALAVASAMASVPARQLPILGFQSDGDPASLIAKDARGLGSIGVDGLNLTSSHSVSVPEGVDLAQLRAARRARLPAVLLVSNWSNAINNFSEPVAWRMLSNAQNRDAVAGVLAKDARSEGWSGISVDMESLLPRDRSGLVAFMRVLRTDLGVKSSLTVCVTAMPALNQYWPNGYDLRGLASSASQIVLMAYDEDGPWENQPGPVGAESWVRADLVAVLERVPAREIDLGVAGYGYAWEPHSNVQLSDAGARKLAGSRARWVRSVDEWTATLSNGTVIWWSDSRTLAVRRRLAASLHLHGLAVWSLGLSDPLR